MKLLSIFIISAFDWTHLTVSGGLTRDAVCRGKSIHFSLLSNFHHGLYHSWFIHFPF